MRRARSTDILELQWLDDSVHIIIERTRAAAKVAATCPAELFELVAEDPAGSHEGGSSPVSFVEEKVVQVFFVLIGVMCYRDRGR